jgi:hypothetical protein
MDTEIVYQTKASLDFQSMGHAPATIQEHPLHCFCHRVKLKNFQVQKKVSEVWVQPLHATAVAALSSEALKHVTVEQIALLETIS